MDALKLGIIKCSSCSDRIYWVNLTAFGLPGFDTFAICDAFYFNKEQTGVYRIQYFTGSVTFEYFLIT